MTVFLDTRSASSRASPARPQLRTASCKKKGLCIPAACSLPRLHPPQSQSQCQSQVGIRENHPSATPAAPLRSRDLYRTKNTVISARSSVTGPPRSSAPSPLHPHPLRCAALYCAAQQVLVPQFTGPASASLHARLVVLEDQSCPPAGCRAPGGFQGAPAGYACRRFSRDPGLRPKHLLSSPLAPGDQGSRPHLLGPATQCPFRHPRCCCFSLPILALSPACPVVLPSELQAGGLVAA